MSTLTRRNVLASFFAFIVAAFGVSAKPTPKYRKVKYVKVVEEPLQQGDFWASEDPNEPEHQGEGMFNLKMRAIHPTRYGWSPHKESVFHGGYWRPVDIIDVY